jgi:hypothetical protein
MASELIFSLLCHSISFHVFYFALFAFFVLIVFVCSPCFSLLVLFLFSFSWQKPTTWKKNNNMENKAK